MTLQITQEGGKVEKHISLLKKKKIEKASSMWLAVAYCHC